MPNYRLTLCYDGTRWKGGGRSRKYRTDHSGKAEEALLSRLLDQPVEVAGSGRTDAGTHAKMQVVSFRAKTQKTTEEILAGLRRYLPADIGAIRLERAVLPVPCPPVLHWENLCLPDMEQRSAQCL